MLLAVFVESWREDTPSYAPADSRTSGEGK